jgi:5'-methylthioinosine phosphorylase
VTIAPHVVNYRANIQLVQDFGADWVVAVNSVGGITEAAQPGRLVIPDQLIDYTSGRRHSYYDDTRTKVKFTEFTEPYNSILRKILAKAAQRAEVDYVAGGTYGATQGPRLETAAEIDRLERDGCNIVGMTGMPEAGLAAELGLHYASLAVVVNRAAGRGPSGLHDEMAEHQATGMASVARVLAALPAFF